MSITVEDLVALEALDDKIRILLPESYRDTYEDVLPVSMGSAAFKIDAEGRVAWNDIWATFCDLAMAGGPPHRGNLLEPATPEDATSDPKNYDKASEEIRRGISMITGLAVHEPCHLGWIGVRCKSAGMAGWLTRAIVMENVLARCDGETLFLPAGPDYRITKEIKNVIVSMAKTCHYWTEHMSADQHASIDALLANALPANTGDDSPLLEPASRKDIENAPDRYRTVLAETAARIHEDTGWSCFQNRYAGWIGVETPGVKSAVWLLRAMAVENILVRREDAVLFLPISLRSEGQTSSRLCPAFARACQLRTVAKIRE